MSGPTIRRAARPEEKFYILDKRLSEDDSLSWQARGLLIFLLGKPDNWQVSVAHLTKCTARAKKKTGRDGVFAIVDELIEAGYIQREQLRGDGGSFEGMQYIVNETPVSIDQRTVRTKKTIAANDSGTSDATENSDESGNAPHPGNPYPGEPNTAESNPGLANPGLADTPNPPLTNTDLVLSTDSSSRTDPTKPSARETALKKEIETMQARWAPDVEMPSGINQQVWLDFLKNRATARKLLTATAMNAMVSAADRAKLSVGDAIEFAVERSWQAFRFEYWLNATGGGGTSQAHSGHRNHGAGQGSAAGSLDSFDDNMFG